ncbi:hypothetical protein SAMN04488503_2283 [Humidesulfovibrio mexicanus]|uniref:Uncharacterized protein n=1 Tax=Humidesulfovibrio mexicanus TaxID=147047 RepID=A0A239AXF7_9BACT|nr:hypothetical protein [Humidesulfovibrio mexicanus]SNS00230.1 hypothetical protein SAMN04488503_2283 [Humidesulfovibrio mexicanus]
MAKVRFISSATVPVGQIERHFGHDFVAQEDGTLIADILDELFDTEVAAGRVVPIEDTPKTLEEMTKAELLKYAEVKAIPVPAGPVNKPELLAVIKAAEEGKRLGE